MPIEQKLLAGDCEITTGAFTPTTAMPVFQGENNAVRLEVSFYNDDVAYSIPADVKVYAYLHYPARPTMTESVEMDKASNVASCDLPDIFTAVSGNPSMVIKMVDGDGNIVVGCAFGVTVRPTTAGTIITLIAPSPDEIIYVGRSPYIGDNGNWYIFDNDTHAFVDSGFEASGNYYVWYKFSATEPTQNSDMTDTPSAWIGWYTGNSVAPPSDYTSYHWYNHKGAKGDKGETGENGFDGVGIDSIEKTSAEGLVDTYTITFSDESTETFTVTNGADGAAGANGTNGTNGIDGIDGEDGANAYVHIKWSATEPTQDEDMKDTPDAWIGIYSGTSETAPTSHTSYVWYQYKGATGATGAAGANGQGVPEGGTTGQALLKTSATNYATEWGGVGRSNPNILHNWDWVAPVNQRGRTGAVSNAYCIDRWIGNGTVTPVTGQYVTLANGTTMIQRMEIRPRKLYNATYTIGINIAGTIQSCTLTFPADGAGSPSVSEVLTGVTVEIGFTDLGSGNTTLIEGIASQYIPYVKLTATAAINVYGVKADYGTVCTLPYDSTEDYGSRLLRCQRYYFRLYGIYKFIATGRTTSTSQASIQLYTPCVMRTTPTATTSNIALLKLARSTASPIPTAIAISAMIGNIMSITVDATVPAAREIVTLYLDNGGDIIFSADL